jgi:hypothetical protein
MLVALFTFVLTLVTVTAHAADIYINGVKVTGSVKGLSIEKVNVRFDDQGNALIDAPGYKIEVEAPPPPPPPAGKFYIIANVAAPGHYDVDVSANGKPVTRIPAGSTTWLTEVTDKLQAGPNGVLFTFLPKPDAPTVPEMSAIDLMVARADLSADGTLTVTRLLGRVARKTGLRMAEAVPVQFELTAP